MKVHTSPIAKITKAWLADADRVVRGRLPGAFSALRNFTSSLADGIGRIRPGYQEYNDANGGIDLPDGMDILKIASIQSPEAEDVHISFCDDGGKLVKMYPHWRGATRVDEHINIGETDSIAATTESDTTSTVVFTGADALGLSNQNDYYNGWVIIHSVSSSGGFYITDYAYDAAAGGTSTFTVHGDPSAFTTSGTYTLARHFHDNPTFAPSYNNDLTAPVTLNVENSVIRLSGGVSATAGNRGIIIFPKLERTFFPDSGDPITFEGTYASERECGPINSATLVAGAPVSTLSGGGDTEVVVPVAATDNVGISLWTNSGTQEVWEQVDEGSSDIDSDYMYCPAGQGSASISLTAAPMTETVDPSGNTVLRVRYKFTMTGSGAGYTAQIGLSLWDSSGEIAAIAQTHTADTGGFVNITLTVPSNSIDHATMEFHISMTNIRVDTQFFVSNVYTTVDTLTVADYLTADRTYWLGVAPVYDGYQIGELYKIETPTDYASISGSWTNNYLSSVPGILRLNFSVAFGRLNKRITGFAIYGAYDEGSVTTRTNPYYFLKYLPIASSGTLSDSWTFTDAGGLYGLQLTIKGTDFTARGNTYLTDAGYLESPSDTMYAYSTEERVSGRRYIVNTYIDSDGTTDTTSIFTNPTGGNGQINAGIIQPDIFSNEEGVLKIKSDPTVGTKINGLVPVGVDEFLILKNRGVIRSRVVVVDSIPALIQKVESSDAGLSTVNAWSKDDGGTVVFPAYDDIYAYRDGVLTRLVERDDKNDWLSTYRGISGTDKENAVVTYLPELKSHIFLFGSQKDHGVNIFDNLQFILGPNGWGSLFYETDDNLNAKRSFKYFTNLSNGHVLGIDTAQSGSATAFRMTWRTLDDGGTYRFGFLDNEEPIIPYFDTGDIYFADGEYLMNEIIVNRTMAESAAGGQLDITVSSGDEIRSDEVGYEDVSSIVNDVETVERRLRMRAPRNIIHKGNRWRMVYNTGNDPNHLVLGEVYQIDSIEIHGTAKSRRKELAE